MVRFKQRYLLFNVLYPEPPTGAAATSTSTMPNMLDFMQMSPGVTQGEISRMVRDSIALNFGDWGAGITGNLSSTSRPSGLPSLAHERMRMCEREGGSGVGLLMLAILTVKYFSPATSTGIIRVAREHYRTVWAAMTFVRELHGRPVVVRVVKISGTIKRVEMEAIRRDREDIKRAKLLGDGGGGEGGGGGGGEAGGGARGGTTVGEVMDTDEEDDEDMDE